MPAFSPPLHSLCPPLHSLCPPLRSLCPPLPSLCWLHCVPLNIRSLSPLHCVPLNMRSPPPPFSYSWIVQIAFVSQRTTRPRKKLVPSNSATYAERGRSSKSR